MVADGYVAAFDHPTHGNFASAPAPFSSTTKRRPCAAPPAELGADTEQVLREVGYTWDEVAAFKEGGTIC